RAAIILADLVRPRRGYERAVEAVLADRLKYVLVEDPREALEDIAFLKSENRGRSSFMPVRSRQQKELQELPSGPGVAGWLREYVDADSAYGPAVDRLLHNVLLVDTLSRALDLWGRGTASTLVTKDGDIVSSEGVVTGGSWEDEKGVLQIRGEISELRQAAADLDAQRVSEEWSLGRLKREAQATIRHVESLGQALEQETRKTVSHEKDFERVEEALRRSLQAADLIRTEKAKLENELHVLEEEIASNLRRVSETELERADLDTELKTRSERLTETRETLASRSQEVTHLKVRVASTNEKVTAHEREEENLRTRITAAISDRTALIENAKAHETDAAACRERAAAAENVRRDAVRRHQEQQASNSALRTSYDALVERIRSEAEVIKGLRERCSTYQEELNALRMTLQEERLRVEYLATQIAERYTIELSSYVDREEFKPLRAEELEPMRSELTDLRERMSKIGDVHLGAIEELHELEERHTFLSQQKDDLEKSLEALSSAIRKINLTTRERFQQTFEDVDAKFQDIFPRLFRGGKARLVLTDPENLLESGIEIVAQPPGKRLQNLNLLSGGEKALTAIALLFAIFLHKAPPFCLLDEVDAPLDDENLRRYLSLVHEMSHQTQFILITHNKSSMEAVQNLYGITMEEPGVSRVVSVQLHERRAAQVRHVEEAATASVA
ncbi:MAG: chromosome segregation protein SMC, partial [Pseudomonadota bacterium]